MVTKLNVGCDTAKDWLDLCVVVDDQRHEKRFPNNQKGCRTCIKWLLDFKADSINVVAEPTGRYSDLIVDLLAAQPNIDVYLVSPRLFNDFKKSLEPRISTDRVSAWALAVYAEERAGKPRYRLRKHVPKSETELKLRDVTVRLRSLLKRKNMLENQLTCGLRDPQIIEDFKMELEEIERHYQATLDYAMSIIEKNEVLLNDFRRLNTIVGIGPKTAIAFLCLIDFRRFKSSRDLCCFLGFTVKKKESGSSIRSKERMSKAGSKFIRAALHYPALSAMRFNPHLRPFTERLDANGKIHPVVRTAVARKLVAISWSLINKDQDYDPHYVGTAH